MQRRSLIFGRIFSHCDLCCCEVFCLLFDSQLVHATWIKQQKATDFALLQALLFLVQTLNLIYKPAVYWTHPFSGKEMLRNLCTWRKKGRRK